MTVCFPCFHIPGSRPLPRTCSVEFKRATGRGHQETEVQIVTQHSRPEAELSHSEITNFFALFARLLLGVRTTGPADLKFSIGQNHGNDIVPYTLYIRVRRSYVSPSSYKAMLKCTPESVATAPVPRKHGSSNEICWGGSSQVMLEVDCHCDRRAMLI